MFQILIGEDSVTGTVLKKMVYFFLGLSIILIPLSFIRPKYFALLSLVFFPLLIFETYHVIQFKAPSTEEVIASLFLTNYSEAIELFESHFSAFILIIILFIVLVLLSIKLKKSFILAKKIRLSFIVFFLLVFTILHGRNYLLANKQKDDFKEIKKLANYSLSIQLKKVYPTDVLIKIKDAYTGLQLKKNYLSTIHDFKFQAQKKDTLSEQEIYVLVLGETARKHNFGIYGYERETTPNLDTISNLVSFSNVRATANLTSLSIPFILTRATPKHIMPKLNEPAILKPFKEAGFKTYWITNQSTGLGNVFGFYSSLADTYINASLSAESSNYDEQLIYELESILKDKSSKKKFIVIHTLGSHFRYNNRYPKEFEKFKPNLITGLSIESSIRLDKKSEIINSYDNSILYTDFVLSSFIDRLDQQNAVSFMYYISDHGENLYDDASEKILHAFINPSKYELEIPLFIWNSKAYTDIYNSKFLNIKNNKDRALASTNTFHTVLDMANIRYPSQDLSLSFSSTKFDSLQKIFFYKTDKTIIKLD